MNTVTDVASCSYQTDLEQQRVYEFAEDRDR